MDSNENLNATAPENENGRGQGRCPWGHDRHRGGRRAWKFLPIFAMVILLKGLFTMLLWNFLIPDLFHGPEVSYLQAVGLIVLAKLVVGFHGPLHRFGHHRRWSALTHEERKKIREHLRG